MNPRRVVWLAPIRAATAWRVHYNLPPDVGVSAPGSSWNGLPVTWESQEGPAQDWHGVVMTAERAWIMAWPTEHAMMRIRSFSSQAEDMP